MNPTERLKALALPLLFCLGAVQGLYAARLASHERTVDRDIVVARSKADAVADQLALEKRRNDEAHAKSHSDREAIKRAAADRARAVADLAAHQKEALARWGRVSAEVEALAARVKALEAKAPPNP